MFLFKLPDTTSLFTKSFECVNAMNFQPKLAIALIFNYLLLCYVIFPWNHPLLMQIAVIGIEPAVKHSLV